LIDGLKTKVKTVDEDGAEKAFKDGAQTASFKAPVRTAL
jgi:hypothetical protein